MNLITSTAINAASSLSVQSGVLDFVNEKTGQTTTAIQGILVLVGLIVGMLIAWRGKNVGSVIMGILVGGLIAALPILITFFSQRAVGETVGMDATSQMVTYAHALISTRA
jgi:hypothetical protein